MSHGPVPRPGRVLLEPGFSDDEVKIRVSPELADDLRELLDAAGINHGAVIELSQTTDALEILALVIGPGGAIWALQPVLISLIERNKARRVVVKHGDDELTIESYSPRQVRQLLEKLQAQRDENARQWAEVEERGRHVRRPQDSD